jgi:hypothetical protein
VCLWKDGERHLTNDSKHDQTLHNLEHSPTSNCDHRIKSLWATGISLDRYILISLP